MATVAVAIVATRTTIHGDRRSQRISYGPFTEMSSWVLSLAGTAAANVTAREPPPAGTVPVPVELAVPLLIVADNEAPPQALAIWPMVTPEKLAPEIVYTTVKPSVSHLATVALLEPSDFDPLMLSEVAWPTIVERMSATVAAPRAATVAFTMRLTASLRISR
jgi:hypothetical protein